MFPCCSTREDLFIDVSSCNNHQRRTDIDESKENSALRHKSKLNFKLYWKKFGFPFCGSYSWRPFHWCINYYYRTDIDEAMVISFLGVRTDTVLESSHGNMSNCWHKKISTQNSKLVVSCWSLYAPPPPRGRGCIIYSPIRPCPWLTCPLNLRVLENLVGWKRKNSVSCIKLMHEYYK